MNYSRLMDLLLNVDEKRVVKLIRKLEAEARGWHRWTKIIVEKETTK